MTMLVEPSTPPAGAPTPVGWSLMAALAAHAATGPDLPALTGPDATLTRAELWQRVLRVAAGLRSRGVRRGDLVAVHGEKTAATVTALLGAVAAGAAYLPIDPSAPADRRRALLLDCGSPRLLARRAAVARLVDQGLPVPVVAVEELGTEADAHLDDLPVATAPDDGVYVLYTSGSTGRPKGVRIPHSALEAFFAAVDPVLGITDRARCLNTTALHFDGSVADLLLPLLKGAHVRLGPAFVVPARVLDLIERDRITHFTAVVSTLTLLARTEPGLSGRDLGALRRILTGAEVLNPATVQDWLHAAPNLVVVNGYGPTEATCGVTFQPIAEREPGRTEAYPIGPPLPGVTIRFRDADGRITTDGPGEIAIAGAQLMSGYLDRPTEEAAVFLDHEGTRFYLTGDIGERGADGALRFAGRRDDEVKIKGYRINLNEVRRTVETHPAVGSAFVAAVPDPRDGLSLACAVVLRPHATVDQPDPDPAVALLPLTGDTVEALLRHVGNLLPRYMVPRELYRLPSVPVLSTGKPDRARITALLLDEAP
ncbi:amino acid adenylation domain-containing protein [Micromonospora sp. NPDC047753]|uniref:amino acid adenylation domain-containing protein n=1 Tax=Micromonospora sp. NPDC047753 TaxID=3154817 RepID=UPI0033C498E2